MLGCLPQVTQFPCALRSALSVALCSRCLFWSASLRILLGVRRGSWATSLFVPSLTGLSPAGLAGAAAWFLVSGRSRVGAVLVTLRVLVLYFRLLSPEL